MKLIFRCFLLTSMPQLGIPVDITNRVIESSEFEMEIDQNDEVAYEGQFNRLLRNIQTELRLCREQIRVYRQDEEGFMLNIKTDANLKYHVANKPLTSKKINLFVALFKDEDVICIEYDEADDKSKLKPLVAKMEKKRPLDMVNGNAKKIKQNNSSNDPKTSNGLNNREKRSTILPQTTTPPPSISVSSLNSSQISHAKQTSIARLHENTRLLPYRLDSEIVKTDKERQGLLELCQFSMPHNRKWNLLYRGTRDGFKAKDFHKKCNRKLRTMTIIKSISDTEESKKEPIECVFGGFSETIHWSMTVKEEKKNSPNGDPSAFIFSFVNAENRPLRIDIRKDRFPCPITGDKRFGPVFGRADIEPENGHDIFIADNSNQNYDNYSDLGSSYLHPDSQHYNTGSENAKNFLAGSNSFKVLEIEVFQRE